MSGPAESQATHARLRWQCRRGMLELDALLGDFLETGYALLNSKEQVTFRKLLDYPDQLLFDYFFGQAKPVDKDVAHVIERIQQAVTPQP
jgi:antitoxin CptB